MLPWMGFILEGKYMESDWGSVCFSYLVFLNQVTMKKLQLNGKDERGVAGTSSFKSLPLDTATQVNLGGVNPISLSSIPLFCASA